MRFQILKNFIAKLKINLRILHNGRGISGHGLAPIRHHELDVVGLASDGTLVAGECKYTQREMNEGDLADLERSAAQVDWTPPEGGDPVYHYCCFARSGFSDGLRAVADERSDVSLFTPNDIVECE